jgi:hypothetical protein
MDVARAQRNRRRQRVVGELALALDTAARCGMGAADRAARALDERADRGPGKQ